MASLISILSTDHGRLRREQRDISKRDVQTAILYGTAERSWGNRWKIEYDGIIFIVNNAKTHEVTAFPAPLALAPLDTNDRIKHTQTRDFLIENPDRCTSHTILVVDNSGSMSTHDINLHRDRQIAAYSVTAMEFIAEQLFKQTATNSDVVTLIEFAGGATEKFRQEPISWALYNKILNCRSTRSFQSREDDDLRDSVNGDTNYMSALEAAAKALDYIVHDRCALSLMFLSDGAPSDAHNLGLTPLAAKRVITAKMEEIALKYKDKLNIQFVGFGSEEQDFSIFENLVEASTKNGAQAEFAYCGKVANQIGCAISSLVSSSTLTRTQLLKSDKHKKYSKREVTLESDIGGKVYWNYHKIIGHYVYNPAEDDFIEYQGLPPGAVIGADDSKNASSTSNVNTSSLPPLLAVSRLPYGKGAERLAYRSSLAYKADEKLHTFNLMVAKETILVERPDDNVEFHRAFCKTQDLASYLAWEFNKCLVAHPSYCKTETPTIVFLPCSVLILDDPEWPGRGVLVEKKLNNEKYEWKKYNDNAGGIDGQHFHAPIDIEYELAHLKQLDLNPIEIIEEGSEEEDETDSDGDDNGDDANTPEQVPEMSANLHIDPTDYINAFSHFTYLFTNKQAMVCDLQGVYNFDMVPPVFELTDPAIHYKSKSGKNNVFGRTDNGEEGVHLFFKTHKCTNVCKLMQLSGKNKKWKKKWKSHQYNSIPPAIFQSSKETKH